MTITHFGAAIVPTLQALSFSELDCDVE